LLRYASNDILKIRRRFSSQTGEREMQRQYYVYILTNRRNTVLYTGVTGHLKRRVYQHSEKLVAGFTTRYNVYKLVFYEIADDVQGAIAREKQIKAGPRRRKIDLVNSMNPEWQDLYEGL